MQKGNDFEVEQICSCSLYIVYKTFTYFVMDFHHHNPSVHNPFNYIFSNGC